MQTQDMDKTVVLLGAGASVDAKVPASTSMTEAISQQILSPKNQFMGITHALNYAVGALIAHKSALGGNPYDGIDVEQLFSAVQMLSDKSGLEIAPFVEWSPTLRSVSPAKRLPAYFDSNFADLIKGKNSRRPSALMQDLVRSMLDTDESEFVFNRLESEMLSALTELLRVDLADLDYLSPLLPITEDLIQIATLNYDRSIETLAASKGLSVDTGIGGWRGGYDWAWDTSAQVRLLKLHGSIDWTLTSATGVGGMTQSAITTNDLDGSSVSGRPGVVFGARGKIRAEGPFLAMLQAFDQMLSEADRLVIVGYSFRDEHINVSLSRWINSAPNRAMTIVDPNFIKAATGRDSRGTYPASLLTATRGYDTATGLEKRRLDLHVISAYAKLGLALAMSDPTAGRIPRRPGQADAWTAESLA
jgi:hypothetical protein